MDSSNNYNNSVASRSGFLSIGDNATHQFLFSWYVSDYNRSNGNVTISWAVKCTSQEDGTHRATTVKLGGPSGDFNTAINYTGVTPVVLTTEGEVAKGTHTYAAGTGFKRLGVSFTVVVDQAETYTGSDIFTFYLTDTEPMLVIPVTGIEDQAVINILDPLTEGNASYTYTVQYTINNVTHAVVTKTYEHSITWTVPNSLYDFVGSTGLFCGVPFTLYSYYNNQLQNDATNPFYLRTTATHCAPTIAPTLVDSNSTTTNLTRDSSVLVRYYSNMEYAINATAKNGATISSMAASDGTQIFTTPTGTFTKAANNTFSFAVINSRGYYAKSTLTPTMINYFELTAIPSFSNPTPAGTVDIQVGGTVFIGSFGATSNTLTVKYRYKEKDGTYGSWASLTPTTTASENKYTASKTLTDLNYQTTYILQFQVTDKLKTITTAEVTMKSTPVFDWSGSDMSINVPLTVTNKITADNGIDVTGDLLVNNQNVGDAIAQIGNLKNGVTYTLYQQQPLKWSWIISDISSSNSLKMAIGIVGHISSSSSYLASGTGTINFSIPISIPTGYSFDSLLLNGINIDYTTSSSSVPTGFVSGEVAIQGVGAITKEFPMTCGAENITGSIATGSTRTHYVYAAGFIICLLSKG